MTFFIQVLFNGLTIGALYVMMALGFTLIFGIIRIVNFAHGEFYMFGAFLVYSLFGIWKVLGYLPALLIVAPLIGLLGMLFERTLFKPIRETERPGGHRALICSFAMAIGMQHVAALIWGVEELSIPPVYKGTFKVFSIFLPVERVAVVGFTFLILIAFYLMLKKSKLGLAMEAVVQDRDAAEIQGIRVNRIYTLSFGVGTLLAGAAGGLVGPVFSLNPFIGGQPLLKAFMAVILGGLGNVTGAIVGGIMIGISESFLSTYFGGAIAVLMTFVVIMIIMVVKPSGLFGEAGT